MIEPLATEFMEYKTKQLKWKEERGFIHSEDDYVFASRINTALCNATFYKNYHMLLKNAGVENANFHTLRHTFAAYHLLCFRNPEETARYFRKLSITQLRQRYSNIPGITRNDAETFWFGPLFDDETPALNGPTE